MRLQTWRQRSWAVFWADGAATVARELSAATMPFRERLSCCSGSLSSPWESLSTIRVLWNAFNLTGGCCHLRCVTNFICSQTFSLHLRKLATFAGDDKGVVSIF